MKHHNRGFGLIEMLIALALGLIVVLGVVQMFHRREKHLCQPEHRGGDAGRRTFCAEQDDSGNCAWSVCSAASARITDASSAGDFNAAQLTPISWDNANLKLTLVTADIGGNGGTPTWTVVSDCRNSATAYTGLRAAGERADRLSDPPLDLQLQQQPDSHGHRQRHADPAGAGE